MRTVLFALVAAAGIGFASISPTLAAPATGSAITRQAMTDSMIVKVGHCRYSRWRRWCHW
jgi:hypothetical protein